MVKLHYANTIVDLDSETASTKRLRKRRRKNRKRMEKFPGMGNVLRMADRTTNIARRGGF